MNAQSKTFWPLVAAVGLGVSLVGYCVYFDRKRRSAPDFAEKLKSSEWSALLVCHGKHPDKELSSFSKVLFRRCRLSRKASLSYREPHILPSVDLERQKQKHPAGQSSENVGCVLALNLRFEHCRYSALRLTQAIQKKCDDISSRKFNLAKIVCLAVSDRWRSKRSCWSVPIYASVGDLDNGVDHLATAVAVCSQPQSLLGLFQQTLPPEVFQELIIRLPRIAQVCTTTMASH